MMKKNKIIIITECPYSGILTAIIENAKLLKKLDFQLYFIVPSVSRDRYGEQLASNIVLLEELGCVLYSSLGRKYRMIFKDKAELEKLLFNFSDYILLSYAGYAGKLSRLLYREGKINILYHIPQCIDIIRRPFWQRPIEYFFERYLSKFCTGYIACSENEAMELNYDFNIRKSNIITIRNYINKVFNRNDNIRKYNFLIVGRVSRDKGVEEILDIAKRTGLVGDFVVIGDGKLLPQLKIKFPQVNFIGNLKHEEIFNYLSDAKFIISNSIIEGLPFSIIEAMHCGVVPIVSNIASHKELIINGENGFLFNNLNDLKNLILESKKMDSLSFKNFSHKAYKSISKMSITSKINFNNHFKKYE